MRVNILLTGATGFIGTHLTSELLCKRNFSLLTVARNFIDLPGMDFIKIHDLRAVSSWHDALVNQDVVIHTAGSAHVYKGDSFDESGAFRGINVDVTLNLARQAAQCGIRRFLFISSIGVNGTISQQPFSETDSSKPSNAYAHSKWEAEQGLWEIQRETGMEMVIIRPPLVYGPHAPGNFGSLVKCVAQGVPLPFGAIHNRRSLVAVDNLVDLIITCIDHPAAANQVFLAGDGQDLSTTELLQGVAKAMGRPSRLLPVSPSLLKFGAALLGKQAMAQQLLGNLQVDITKACTLLDWKPPICVEEGLRRCFQPQNK
jgi:nucleoside-diphosphate-sugar epimerase